MEGVGFAMGLERLLMIMEEEGCDFPPENTCDVYLVSIGERAAAEAFRLAGELRAEGFFAQSDLMGRSVKAQMKYAGKIGAKYTLVLGDDELEKGEANLKAMHSGKTMAVPLGDGFSDAMYEEILSSAYADLEEAMEGLDQGGCGCGHEHHKH